MSRGECEDGPPGRRAARARSSRLWVASLLLIALPLIGLSGVLAQLLGTTHVHRPAAVHGDPLQGWQDFRRIVVGAAAARTTHGHTLWLKHRHGAADATVLALGPAGPGSTSADAVPSLVASIVLHAATMPEPGLHVPEVSSLRWRQEPPGRFKSLAWAPPERPPKA